MIYEVLLYPCSGGGLVGCLEKHENREEITGRPVRGIKPRVAAVKEKRFVGIQRKLAAWIEP